MIRELDKKINAALLIFFGSIGAILAAVRVFLPRSVDAPGYTLFIVGLLCVGLGVQRLGSIQEVLDFVKSDKLTWLDGSEEVYAKATRMIQNCKHPGEIRATDLLPYEKKPEEFKSYFTAIAKRMATGRVVYRLVFANDKAGRDGLDMRRGIIAATPAHVGQMEARYVEQTFPLEVLIVGTNVVLGFPDLAEGHPVTRGILIEDEVVAQQFVKWYDNLLFFRANP